MPPLDYVDHFKLREAPFGQTPSPEFFYAADQHDRLLDGLYHVARNMLGLAVLTGPSGTGKTTLLRALQRLLPADGYQVATWVLHRPCTHALDLLRSLSQCLAIRVAAPDPDAVFWNIQRYAQGLHHRQRRLILLVDEAQMLEGAQVLETLRALLNLDCDGHRPVTIVLAGLDGLLDNLDADPELVARIACRGALVPFLPEESLAYVRHRLSKAGAPESLFETDILERVHRLADGVPRVINTLCDNVLLRLARTDAVTCSPALLDTVAHALRLEPPEPLYELVASEPPVPVPMPRTVPPPAAVVRAPSPRSDLLSQANDIAARLAQGAPDEITPPGGLVLPPPEATVELAGDAWPGVQAAGDFLNNSTPPQGLDPRGRARTDEDVVMSILNEARGRFE